MDTVSIKYTNYKGITEDRMVDPVSLKFKSTEWHPEKQWLLKAYCHERDAVREFAVKDIQNYSLNQLKQMGS